MRRLAVDVDRYETFASYVDRLAEHHDTALGSMMSRLGLITEDNQKNLAGYGVTLEPAIRQRFAFVAGLSEVEVSNLLLARFSPRLIVIPEGIRGGDGNAIRKAAVSEWAYFSGSHFCPDCLRESNGVWSSLWKLPWSFACVRHGVLLHDSCPVCQRRPRAGLRDGRLYPPFHAQVPTPLQCNNAMTNGASGRGKAGRPCGCLFSSLQSIRASAAMLQTQTRVDQEVRDSMGKRLPTDGEHTFFAELRSVSALMMYGGEPEDLPLVDSVVGTAFREHVRARETIREQRSEAIDGRNGPRQRTYIGVPTSAALMAALVQTALPIVDAASPDELRSAMQPLADRVRSRSPKNHWDVAGYFQLLPRLRTALAECAEVRGNFDRRGGARSTTANTHKPHRFQPQHVPQLFPPEAFARRFKRYFPALQENLARRFCSMAAVKLLGFTWAQSGQALELPETADRQANHMITQLNKNGYYDAFTRELQTWARVLSEGENRIDYQLRRDALRAVSDFSRSVWLALCAQGGITPGHRGSRSRYAAAWMWADSTCGDWGLSPAFRGESTANQRDVYKIMTKLLQPEMRDALRTEANRRVLQFQSVQSDPLARQGSLK